MYSIQCIVYDQSYDRLDQIVIKETYGFFGCQKTNRPKHTHRNRSVVCVHFKSKK